MGLTSNDSSVRFFNRQLLYAYLHTAIFSRPELDGMDISDRQLDTSQLEQYLRDA
jgi:hypothetical protein